MQIDKGMLFVEIDVKLAVDVQESMAVTKRSGGCANYFEYLIRLGLREAKTKTGRENA